MPATTFKAIGTLNGNYKHGFSDSRLDRIYYHMIGRCHKSSHKSYERYGAKGIHVCDEWRNDKKAFFQWAMDNGYSDNLTIDRIDGTKGYYPGNCRWATYKEQANNIKTNRVICIDGVSHTMTEWAEIKGIRVGTLFNRLTKGWDEKKADMTPTKTQYRNRRCRL